MRLKSVYILFFVLSFSCKSTKHLKPVKKELNSPTAITKDSSSVTAKNEVVQTSFIDSTKKNIVEERFREEYKLEIIFPSKVFTIDSISTKTIHDIWNKLLQKNVNETGEVNYKSFRNDRSILKEYLYILSSNLPSNQSSIEEKKAYWINAYNAFTIKLIIDNYPLKSIKDIKDPWDVRLFKLGKKWYNLNEIEHKILRPMGDPRIHFGINCASISCPPLANKAYTADNIEELLNRQAIKFINDPLRNNISPNILELSKIFSWFAKDFKIKGSLIDFLNIYSNIQIERNAKKSFLLYNWSLNTQ